MSDHDDEVLARVVTGELEASSREVHDLMARRPELQDELDEVLALQARLRSERAAERAAVASAKAATEERDEAAVRAAFPHAGAFATPRRAHWWLLAAAAALIAFGVIWMRGHNDRGRSQFLAGDRSIELSLPTRPLHGGDTLRWTGELKPGERWRVHIRERTSGGADARVLVDETCRDSLWIATESALRDWPSEVLWRVERMQGTQTLGSSVEVPLQVSR